MSCGNKNGKRVYNSFVDWIRNRNKIPILFLIFHSGQLYSPSSVFKTKRKEFEVTSFRAKSIVVFHRNLELGSDSILDLTKLSTTISDAEKRATSLLAKIANRNVHSDVPFLLKAELFSWQSNFHAVFEPTKSVCRKKLETSIGNDIWRWPELVDLCIFNKIQSLIIIHT